MRSSSHRTLRAVTAISRPSATSTATTTSSFRSISSFSRATHSTPSLHRNSLLSTTTSRFSLFSRLLSSAAASSASSSASSASSSTSASAAPRVLDHASSKYTKYVSLKPEQRLIILGFGAIGQGVLPLLYRHINMQPSQVSIVANEFTDRSRAHANDYKAQVIEAKLTRTDYLPFLQKHVRKGDFLINVSVDVSSVALIEHCQNVGALYLDTCNEPWAGGYSDPTQPAAARSNYAFREQALRLREKLHGSRGSAAGSPTALITHGANPGMVSHFVKQALLNIARDTGVVLNKTPGSRDEWVDLSEKLGIKTIHIAEKDTQAAHQIKHDGEFVNTWSIEGYCEEGKQPAELGWGTHEKRFPADGRKHEDGCQAAIYLDRPGANTLVRTWTPKCGVFHGMLITHTEAISIADYFTKKDAKGNVTYRPTVNFAYHPCDDAIMSMKEVAYKEWIRHPVERVMMDEIVSGRDELGVLLMGHSKGAYWYGSNLTIDEARRVAPNNNATSLQVCTSVLSGAVWTLENPQRGLIEPEEINEVQRVIEISKPYLGELDGFYNQQWTPLHRRNLLFPEPQLDQHDPWQFDNFRVY